ncbi:exosome complex component RRP43 isoform X1 [Lingula anatina]|uniref:Ribosomal RNA-processing protein 43 n=1 Tax=Lingula anatina TaxID=7574 RepID=A0A1S3HTH6_LINAN|nr:exosome complex component RRP43 isoform X1 [Lingula anatina]|eukprot:XP_013388851.1 exosome complex component RRP43 isoform X1 [Lingula anatina]
MAADFKTAQPVEYYRKFVEKDVRPDGRELGEIRPTMINIGSISTAEGSALVKLGNTTVLCGVKAEVTNPKSEEPDKGIIVPNVDLPALCSPRFRPGPPSEQAQVVSQFMVEVIQNSGCIDPKDLCIKAGKHVWVLYCDLVCLDYDGNVTDACVLALMAALKNVSLPKVTLNEESGNLETHMQEKWGLNILCQPVATTFAIFDDCIVFADPTDEEENLATGKVTIVTTEEDKICFVHKPGGSPLSDDKLQNCLQRSFIRAREARNLVETTLVNVDR